VSAMRRSRALPRHAERGGAVVELAIAALFLMLMVFGIVDFGRALLVRHAITSMSREAANLESRGTPMSTTLQATIDTSGAANLAVNGYVILTAVERDQRGRLSITKQLSGGGVPQGSRVGRPGSTEITLPNSGVPLRGQTLYVAEIFVRFAPVTPIGNFVGSTLPSMLYDVAYF
jgi:Flp pilus assembly protein TadG